MAASATMQSTIQEPTTVASDPMMPEPYRIARVKRENYDTFTLELTHAQIPTDFRFQPGQFNMLYVYGVGEIPISISGDPARTDVITHTTRAVGNVTRALQRLRAGDVIGLRGPFGAAWPAPPPDRDCVIVTGGIGLAPLRPVIYSALSSVAPRGKLVLLYGARTPRDLLFATELRSWSRRKNCEVRTTVDRADESWRGNIGVVTTLIPQAGFTPAGAVALVCGPEIMMRFTVKALQARGVPAENIYLSMERNMKCAVGFCGHCQFGPEFICKDGPVFPFPRIERLLTIREL